MPHPQSIGEFARIERFFKPLAAGYGGAYGLSDDAATISVAHGEELVITTDALVAGVHFFASDPPDLIAQKALRCNLSDLAAKGAKPLAYSLALIAPITMSDQWLEQFCLGLARDQREFGISLLGGDTVATVASAPLSLAITAYGTVKAGAMVRRQAVALGDELWVSGTIGDAALGLRVAQNRLENLSSLSSLSGADRDYLHGRYLLPQPRQKLGLAMAQLAAAGERLACLDISDGLLADLAHMVEADSSLQIVINRDQIPLSRAAARLVSQTKPPEEIGQIVQDSPYWQTILSGGDDYELAIATADSQKLIDTIETIGLPRLTKIGKIVTKNKPSAVSVRVIAADGCDITPSHKGYDHFKE